MRSRAAQSSAEVPIVRRAAIVDRVFVVAALVVAGGVYPKIPRGALRSQLPALPNLAASHRPSAAAANNATGARAADLGRHRRRPRPRVSGRTCFTEEATELRDRRAAGRQRGCRPGVPTLKGSANRSLVDYRALVHETRGDPNARQSRSAASSEVSRLQPRSCEAGEAESSSDDAMPRWRLGARTCLPEPAPSEAAAERDGTPGRRRRPAYAALGVARASCGGDPAGAAKCSKKSSQLSRVRSGTAPARHRVRGARTCRGRRTGRPSAPTVLPDTILTSIRPSCPWCASRAARRFCCSRPRRRRGNERCWREYTDSARPGVDPEAPAHSRSWGRCCGRSGVSTRRWTFSAVSSGWCHGDPRVAGDVGRCLSGLRRYGEAESSCAERSRGSTTPTTATTSGSFSTARAGWRRRWRSIAGRSPTIPRTGMRSTTSALRSPGPDA